MHTVTVDTKYEGTIPEYSMHSLNIPSVFTKAQVLSKVLGIQQ